ncbi:MAG: hypothetical protein AAF702_41570 [Chloroflexota bacterium]
MNEHSGPIEVTLWKFLAVQTQKSHQTVMSFHDHQATNLQQMPIGHLLQGFVYGGLLGFGHTREKGRNI